MRLSRKIEKLLSPDVFLSGWEHLCRWTHPISARDILARIDGEQLARLRERYPARANARQINAYENAAYWIGVNVRRVQDLWLDRTPPLRILDLGCGPGYFLYISQLFGHSGIGLDTPDEPLFEGLTQLLNIQRLIARIERQVPLPDLGEEFDLITAHRVCFHRISRVSEHEWREWSPADWKFFIDDVRARFLKPHGRMFLELNPRYDGSSAITPDIRAAFLAEGARISRTKVLFAAEPSNRPRFKL
ncbi:MAG TPA: class I SAM-dependent methyltransferase [Chthoniobacterales bacterium]|nr:class I SAM-dependent methyltransferase [Chthoniobacterales bacterium]